MPGTGGVPRRLRDSETLDQASEACSKQATQGSETQTLTQCWPSIGPTLCDNVVFARSSPFPWIRRGFPSGARAIRDLGGRTGPLMLDQWKRWTGIGPALGEVCLRGHAITGAVAFTCVLLGTGVASCQL